MSGYTLDPEVAAFVARSEAVQAGSGATLADRRAAYERMALAFARPHPSGLRVETGVLRATGPARALGWRRYVPADAVAGCCVLYLHGGGWVVGGLDSHDSICADLAAGSGLALLALDYRLSPEHLYPAAVDDTQAAYQALRAEGRRVVVAGDSAGGNLAAALCLRLRRLGGTPPLGQVLIYPGLHPCAGRAVGTWREAVPMLRAADSIAYRRHYTGREDVSDTGDPELAPLAARDWSGLPPAAIFAADIDPLAEDSAEYAAALRGSGVPASLHAGEGLVHGYLRGRHDSARIAAAFAAIVQALRDLATRS